MKKTITIKKNHIFFNKDLIKFHNKPENSNYQEFIVNNIINESEIKNIKKKDKNYKEEKKLFSSLLKSKSNKNISNFSEIKLKNELLNFNLYQTNYNNNNNIINNNEDFLVVFGKKFNVISQNTSFSNSKKQLLKRLIRPPIYKTKLENKNKKEEEKENIKNNNIKNSENLYPIKIANSIYSKLNSQKKSLFNNVKLKEKFFNININNRNKNKSFINFSKFLNNNNNNKNFITNYLSLRSYNSLPITFPINLSYNNKYETFSEKNRQEKIIDKFIKLKTIIKKFPNEKNNIIKEFLIKNNIIDKKYYTLEKINNFLYFLNHPFNFDPKKSLIDIINEAVNYKPNNQELLNDQNQLKPINYFKNSDYNTINDNNNNNENNIINNDDDTNNNENPKDLKNNCKNIDLMKYSLNLNKNITNINDKDKLIKELENELEIIQNEKKEKLKFSFKNNTKYLSKNIHNNNLNNNNNTININNLQPNLCLSTINFKSKYLSKFKNSDKKKSLSLKEKEKKINEINNRLYYNKMFKDINDDNNDLNTVDIDYIKRKLKLTEFIYLNRIKNKEKINNIKIKYNF